MLRDQTRENKDPQKILISTWHLKFNPIPSVLKNNFNLISNDPKLTLTYQKKKKRKKKLLSDNLLKNDIANQQLHYISLPCGKCKLYPQINTYH